VPPYTGLLTLQNSVDLHLEPLVALFLIVDFGSVIDWDGDIAKFVIAETAQSVYLILASYVITSQHLQHDG
jgi:hypothetical protein